MHLVVVSFTLVVTLLSIAAGHGHAALSPLQPCTIADVARAAECGSISVRENRAVATGRQIDLYVVVLKAPNTSNARPVLFFAGGPGQGAATMAAAIMRDLTAVAPDRDVILIDQRGTGRSHPLTCDDGFLLLDRQRRDEFDRCREALMRVADLRRYGTNESADDAADVLRVLGYARVEVIATSYGTRLALRFMQRHGSMVNSAVLRAVAPHRFNILADGARYAREALARVVADCRSDAACHAAFPDMESELTQLRARLREKADPMTLDQFDRIVYALLLSTPTRQLLPWLIHTSLTKDGAALTTIGATVNAIYKTVGVGAYLSVVCGEDAPLVRKTAPANDEFAAGTAPILEACATWPAERLTPRPLTPSLQPTLVVSGALDPAMPPGVGEQALRELPRGRHIVVPATAHGPLFPGCVSDLVRLFITNSTAALDQGCTASLTAPPFRVQ